MTLHNEFKTWLKDLGLNSDFKFYKSAYEEIEMLGSQEVATENEYYDLDISKKLMTILDRKEFKKYRSKIPNNLAQIITLNRYVRLKTRTLCVRSYDNA